MLNFLNRSLHTHNLKIISSKFAAASYLAMSTNNLLLSINLSWNFYENERLLIFFILWFKMELRRPPHFHRYITWKSIHLQIKYIYCKQQSKSM